MPELANLGTAVFGRAKLEKLGEGKEGKRFPICPQEWGRAYRLARTRFVYLCLYGVRGICPEGKGEVMPRHY